MADPKQPDPGSDQVPAAETSDKPRPRLTEFKATKEVQDAILDVIAIEQAH